MDTNSKQTALPHRNCPKLLILNFDLRLVTIRPDVVKTLIYLKPSSDQHRKLPLLEHDSRTILCCEKSRLSDGLGRCRMIRLIAIAGFALSVVSAQAMTPAPIPQPDSMVTEVAAACGAGRTRVNGVCVARTTVRQTRRAVRRCATGMTC